MSDMAKLAAEFDPGLHMTAPFKAFMEAARECRKQGYMVFIGPDNESPEWDQQLFIHPVARCLTLKERESDR